MHGFMGYCKVPMVIGHKVDAFDGLLAIVAP
jgi:hypothetical protein